MKTRKWMCSLTACWLCLCGLASPAMSQESVFTYQGELQQNGSPANGQFDMVISVWDDPVSGLELANNAFQNVPVVNGRFTVELDMGFNPFTTEDRRYLQVEVEGEQLVPRRQITKAPFTIYSLQTRGINVDNQDNIGLGTEDPFARLDVVSDTTNSGNNTARFAAPLIGGNTSHVHYGLTGDWYIRSADETGKVILQDTGGSVGIGASNPGNTAKVFIEASDTPQALTVRSTDDQAHTLEAVNIGAGTAILAQNTSESSPVIDARSIGSAEAIRVHGNSDSEPGGGGLIIVGETEDRNLSIDNNEIMARNNGEIADLHLNADGGLVFIGASAPSQNSRLVTPVLQITGGSDFSEMFDVGGIVTPQAGMVVAIDPASPGRLVPSSGEYDRKVAGIISGAGGVATGMTMGQVGTIADGRFPVALSGRVYCLADATVAEIQPGDLLTSSSRAGHAMKVVELGRASGATIGKAMTPLAQGEVGLVLVLVNLQ